MKERVESLDYLRGIMALSVLFTHYYSWSYSNNVSGVNIPVRLGIYAVSTFYLLSGLSLAIVYHNRIHSLIDIRNFLIKRIFRILPLMWLVITLELLHTPLSYYHEHNYTLSTIFMNYTATFGFLNPRNYIAFGTWSIGNEMVFYTLFPLFIILYNKKVRLGLVATSITIVLGMLLAFLWFNPQSDLAGTQWSLYIQPVNQLFLFASGISIFYLLREHELNKRALFIALLILITAFIGIPIYGKATMAVSGLYRLYFSFICICVVIIFYKTKINLPNYFKSILNKIGASSYSIYLLHTFVFKLFQYVFGKFHIVFPIAIISLFGTLILSFFVYTYLELPFMRLAKKITEERNKSADPSYL